MSAIDSLVNETIVDHIFARWEPDAEPADEVDDAYTLPVSRHLARAAARNAASEAQLVEELNVRCARSSPAASDDPAQVASLQRLAQLAWMHYHHARAAAAEALNDPTFGGVAQDAVTRAHRAALAIRRVAARAVTRAALRARDAARARVRAPARLRHARRQERCASRPRAHVPRRIRVSALATAGPRGDDPGPAPPDPWSNARLPAGRRS